MNRGSDPGLSTTRQPEEVYDPVDPRRDEGLGSFGEGESKRVGDGLPDGEDSEQRVLLLDEGSVNRNDSDQLRRGKS